MSISGGVLLSLWDLVSAPPYIAKVNSLKPQETDVFGIRNAVGHVVSHVEQ